MEVEYLVIRRTNGYWFVEEIVLPEGRTLKGFAVRFGDLNVDFDLIQDVLGNVLWRKDG